MIQKKNIMQKDVFSITVGPLGNPIRHFETRANLDDTTKVMLSRVSCWTQKDRAYPIYCLPVSLEELGIFEEINPSDLIIKIREYKPNTFDTFSFEEAAYVSYFHPHQDISTEILTDEFRHDDIIVIPGVSFGEKDSKKNIIQTFMNSSTRISPKSMWTIKTTEAFFNEMIKLRG